MIFKRLYANLRAQNWVAIGIEFAIVVAGVFVGTQVSNWNQARLEKAATERMLDQLVPELESQLRFFDEGRRYYATTRAYAETALAGWARDPKVGDKDFVIAAYQATQIYGYATNTENWTLVFGGEQFRNIDDPEVRRNLGAVLTADYSPVSAQAVATPYRQAVRGLIPTSIQDRIRTQCGDRPPEAHVAEILPSTCPIALPPADVAKAAAALRARPELVMELHRHLAAVAAYLANAELLEFPLVELHRQLRRGA